jgi:hypothetical protein
MGLTGVTGAMVVAPSWYQPKPTAVSVLRRQVRVGSGRREMATLLGE